MTTNHTEFVHFCENCQLVLDSPDIRMTAELINQHGTKLGHKIRAIPK